MDETIRQLCEEIYGKNYNKIYEKYEEAYAEGYKKGKIRALAWVIKNFMRTCDKTFKETCEIIEVEDDIIEDVRKLALDENWTDWDQIIPGIDD